MKFINRFGVLTAIALSITTTKAALLQSCNKNGVSVADENCSEKFYCIDDDTDSAKYITGSGAIYPLNLNTNTGKCEVLTTPASPVNTSAVGNKIYLFFDGKTGEIITDQGSDVVGYTCTYTAGSGISDCTPFGDGVSDSKYFINSQSNTLAGALVSCSTSSSCNLSDGKNGAYYPGSNGLIKCEDDKCQINNDATAGNYYLSTVIGYIIKCTTNGCDNVPVTSETYFLNGDSSSSYQLIYCNGSQCEGLTTTSGNYVDGSTGKIIVCTPESQCQPKTDVANFYLSTNPNILIDCTDNTCENIQAKIGIYISGKETQELIQCDSTSCNKLTQSDMLKIPICNASGNKCSVVVDTQGSVEASSLIPEGGYCTDVNRSILYYAANTIEREDSIVANTSNNCYQASSSYFQYYYTVGPNIYHIDDGEISQITAAGYYFINTNSNKLVTGSKIEDYNNSYVKLYKCNGISCVVIPTPSSTTYYVDVSKRIFKYSGNTFSFAYDKDVLCAYANNKCVPNTDLKNTEFCVTSAGELVIAATDIEAKKTGDCYKSTTINNEIFGYSSNLYKLNLYDATIIDTTGYYLINVNSNSTTEYKEFSNKNNEIILYGCSLSSCSVKTPTEGVYYYDNISHYLVRYDSASSQWVYPTADGYALISTEPGEQYVRKFTVDSTSTNKVTITGKVSDGYYYTTDNEMYECPNTDGSSCDLIDESMYVMTNDNELYYCNVDDDNLASTVCNKQSCVLGELYYIGGYHFRCVTGNIFNILSTKYCNADELVVVNFPTAFSETYPSNVKSAVDDISKNNNNTATVKAGSNHLTVIPGIFTNCTYDKEEKMASFDLVCIENYVILDNEKEPQICSTAKLGFVGCNEDSENPDKCNPSSAMTIFLSKVAIAFAMLFFSFMLF
ncbi:hypothetical protein BCR32DRAFT_294287 [Anaeromyces robustus]|uniref:Scaffoldin n=1 Tax=Anaeromyces robustus TaxID=1754192 RepID=A0A1Y1X1Y7_9FUNG|nr:hypothetical protein BCR32DRAFT_294287 [Anaeromyces robustus]|eukprot:ORX79675.1 hypothetical protein BCR32DRAFT_294287 [Anaeromyces robustus]